MAVSAEARSPYALLDEVERARDVLVLTYTASLDFFERFALADARALGALVTVVSDATMVRADPVVVRRAGVHYLDARAVCPGGTAFHPKLVVVVGEEEARVAVGSGNLTTAGWHANAETWTVLRADGDGGPSAIREVAAFLRSLSEEVVLSAGAGSALTRVADGLDRVPAEDPGPRLLHSLAGPINEQLPDTGGPVDELVLYAPFHDAALAGIRDLLDRLAPRSWTVFVQPDTVVNGLALEELCSERGGRLAWISRRFELDDGGTTSDSRYWHGKLVQWRTAAGETWALTGSPNISRPALLQGLGSGGNCELAVLSRIDSDLRPAAGDPPSTGVSELNPPVRDRDKHRGPVLLSARAAAGDVLIELTVPLVEGGIFEIYDTTEDRWTRTADVAAGEQHYRLDVAAAPVGRALRIRTASGSTSNEVFVADPKRLARRQQRAIGKVRTTLDRVIEEVLGAQLLSDIEELRTHLLVAGATVRTPRSQPDNDIEDPTVEVPVARPAPGQTLEDFLEACDPVLGQRMTEFALVLPALPGIGVSVEEEVGTLESDEDEDLPESPGEAEEKGRSVRGALHRATPDQRERYRQFVERLVERSPQYPMLIRTLAVRTMLHSIGAGLWSDEAWPELLAGALRALAARGDEPNEWERRAAASLAAVGLGLLRTDVPRMSRRDEHQMRYSHTADELAALLVHRDPEQLLELAKELSGPLAGAPGAAAAELAAEEALNPPRGVDRAVGLLAEEQEIEAHVSGDATIVLVDPIRGLPEPQMARVLDLAGEAGPVFGRATTMEGRDVLAAWCAPWFVVERGTQTGKTMVSAWRLPGQTLYTLTTGAELPRPDVASFAGADRPEEVAGLLALADEDNELG